MRIGIDFDDTIVETTEKVCEYVKKYSLKEPETLEERENFYRKYIDNITVDVELKPDVLEVLNKLSKNNELYLITARSEYYSKNVPELVLKYINDNNLPFKDVFLGCYGKTKATKCKELGIQLFIDDLVDNCLPVKELGIEVLLFQSKCDGFKTVNSWNEVLDYMEEKYGRKDSN